MWFKVKYRDAAVHLRRFRRTSLRFGEERISRTHTRRHFLHTPCAYRSIHEPHIACRKRPARSLLSNITPVPTHRSCLSCMRAIHNDRTGTPLKVALCAVIREIRKCCEARGNSARVNCKPLQVGYNNDRRWATRFGVDVSELVWQFCFTYSSLSPFSAFSWTSLKPWYFDTVGWVTERAHGL